MRRTTTTSGRWPVLLTITALLPVAALASCGSDDDTTASGAGGGHDMAGMNHDDASAAAGTQAMSMDMAELGSQTKDGVKVTLAAMPPETFSVPEGDQQVKHAPTADDTVHLMAALADAESGVRLPDATVTAKVASDAGTAFDGPLYPMIGRGMGMHYGENMAIKAPGSYTVTIVASPPKVGRHTDVETAWSKTITLRFPLTWDGTTATAG